MPLAQYPQSKIRYRISTLHHCGSNTIQKQRMKSNIFNVVFLIVSWGICGIRFSLLLGSVSLFSRYMSCCSMLYSILLFSCSLLESFIPPFTLPSSIAPSFCTCFILLVASNVANEIVRNFHFSLFLSFSMRVCITLLFPAPKGPVKAMLHLFSSSRACCKSITDDKKNQFPLIFEELMLFVSNHCLLS